MRAPYRVGHRDATDLPARLAAELEFELAAGERVVWTGRPRRGRVIALALQSLLFPMVWNGLLVSLVVASAGRGSAAGLAVVPLLIVGLPFFRAPFTRIAASKNTFYAVTCQRILVFDENGVEGHARTDVNDEGVTARGNGDVTFALHSDGRNLALVGVDRAPAVAALLRGEHPES